MRWPPHLSGSILLLCALTGCAAPSTQAPQASAAAAVQPATRSSASTEPTSAQPTAEQAPAAIPDLGRLHPRTGGPLPPRAVDTPIRIDRSCASDSDCAVKDVGNCCGAAPACVNVDSPTDPKAVQAECTRKGMASICGFKPIDHCQCVQGQCHAELMMSEAQ